MYFQGGSMRLYKRLLTVTLTLIAVLILLLPVSSVFGEETGQTESKDSSSWILEYEGKLNERYVDAEKGLVSFKVEGSSIFVTVDPETCDCSYLNIAMKWARHFSKEKAKHMDSFVASYIVLDGEIMTTVNYSQEKGYH
jgi:hypothetical protein